MSQGLPDREAASLTQRMLALLSLDACFPTSSSSRDTLGQEERQRLVHEDSYDDSDAISLLSNIADRSRRRSRRRNRRATATVFGCGLFGRPKGQIQGRDVTTGDILRDGRARSRARQREAASDPEHQTATRHSRSDSTDTQSTADTMPGLGAGQESGDEDAGMLADADIAELSHSREEEDHEGVQQSKDDEQEKRQAEERKAQMQREADEHAREEAETLMRQKQEEEQLALEEEAAAAKAERRAERRAIKESWNQTRLEAAQRSSGRRLTEAEAEAAAGGFDFADEHEHEETLRYDDEAWNGEDVENADDHWNSQQGAEFGLAKAPEGYGYYEQDSSPAQGVVHHHHYYHEPEQSEEETFTYRSPPPQISVPQVLRDDGRSDEEAVEEDEEDADIAGLTFGKKKNKVRNAETGSYASRSNGSGSGSRQSGSTSQRTRMLYEQNRAGSNGSGGFRNAGPRSNSAGGGGSSNGSGSKPSYRDRPRRHERTASRSSGSKPVREAPAGKAATSPVIPESVTIPSLPAESDDRADAAAGGFDGLLTPPIGTGQLRPSSESSSSHSARRREQPRVNKPASPFAGLNAPRNPQGGNIFAQNSAHFDSDVDGW